MLKNNHVHDLLPFYLNSTLNKTEQAAVEAHLKTCPVCQAELREWQTIEQAVQAGAQNSATSLPPLRLPVASHRVVPLAPLTPKTNQKEMRSMVTKPFQKAFGMPSLRGLMVLTTVVVLLLFALMVSFQIIAPKDKRPSHGSNIIYQGPNSLTPTPQPSLPTVYATLHADPRLSEFAAAIAGNEWLSEITQRELVTIFVLPNDIFEPMQTEIEQALGQNPTALEGFLFSHMVNDLWTTDRLASNTQMVGQWTQGGYSYGSKIYTSRDADSHLVLNGQAHIVESLEAANGYVHILDAPLVTAQSFLMAYQGTDSIDTAPTLYDIITHDPLYSKFAEAIARLGYNSWIWPTLTSPTLGSTTLFVPNNLAVQAMFYEGMSVELMEQVITAHMVKGLWSRELLAEQGTIRSTWEPNGQTVVSTVQAAWSQTEDNVLIINQRARVIKGDVIAANGIIHFIDVPLTTALDYVSSPQPPTRLLAAPENAPAELKVVLDEMMALEDITARQAKLDELWSQWQSASQIPYIAGNTVAFMYRGEATSVEWRGDFNGWVSQQAYRGQNFNGTDLWIVVAQFPTSARLDYKILLDGQHWILDPANPYQQWSGSGPNSELRMPDYVPSEWAERRDGTAQGQLSDPIALDSVNLGYTIAFRVYTPTTIDQLENLPVMYVLDGQDYADARLGSLPIVLDNLIAAGQIEPIIAVFIDPRNPENLLDNRREAEYANNSAFADFLGFELVPYIDLHYPTDARPERRLIMGASLGGQAALFTAIKNPPGFVQFGMVAAQSPSFDDTLLDLYRQAATRPLEIWLSYGTPEWDVEVAPLRTLAELRGYRVITVQVNEGHSWGNWRGLLDELVIQFFGDEPQ